jgi:hypothetical protein
VDQSSIGAWGGAFNIETTRLEQTFRPEASTLTDVNVGLNRMGPGPTSLTVTVREGTSAGLVIASATRLLPDYAPGMPFDFDAGTHLEHFAFDAPAATTPGQVYVIQLNAGSGGLGWAFTNDDYANGSPSVFGQTVTAWDFMFETCGDGDGKVCKDKTQILFKPPKPKHHGCIDFNAGDICYPF